MLIPGADKNDSKMLCTSNMPHQRDDDPMMRDLSALAANTSKDGTMLGCNIVEQGHGHMEDIDSKLPQKLGRVHGGVVGSLGGGKQVSCLMELFSFVANSHMCTHIRNTTNGSCGNFASNSCPIVPRC